MWQHLTVMGKECGPLGWGIAHAIRRVLLQKMVLRVTASRVSKLNERWVEITERHNEKQGLLARRDGETQRAASSERVASRPGGQTVVRAVRAVRATRAFLTVIKVVADGDPRVYT